MRVFLTIGLLALLSGQAYAQPQAAAGAPPGDQRLTPGTPAAQRELAALLVRDAQMDGISALWSATDAGNAARPGDERVRLQRAAVLARFAIELDPQQRQAYLILAGVAAREGDFEQAAQAQEGALRAAGYQDHQAFLQWLRYRLSGLSDAPGRAAFLQSTADMGVLPAPARAAALTNLAVVEEGRGDSAAALDLYRRAVQLDACQGDALAATARLEGPLPARRRAATAVATLHGDPLAWNVASETAWLCQSLGLAAEAVRLYELAIAAQGILGQKPTPDFQLAYLDALLDAGLDRRAISEFEEAADNPASDPAVPMRLIDAYLQIGQTPLAEAMMQKITTTDETVVAWMNLMYMNRPGVAEQWAAQALARAPNDPYAKRVWAMAALRTGRALSVANPPLTTSGAASASVPDAAEELQLLAGQDAYAAAALVDAAFARGPTEGQAQLDKARDLPRTGPGWRYLARVAKQHNARLPAPPAAASEVAAELAGLDPQYVRMVQQPQTCVALQLEPVAPRIMAGDPLVVRATLTNTSTVPLPLGEPGLLRPEGVLVVTFTMPGSVPLRQEVPFTWAAPRYLEAGQSLQQVVRVDMGAAGESLRANPLAEVDVRVDAALDPIGRQGQFTSRLPSVPVTPAVIHRAALSGGNDPQAYYNMLAGLVSRFQGADQVQAMRAAEATVSLLLMVQREQAGQVAVPAPLVGHLRNPELHSMLRYCLQQAPPPVQAHTLGAMRLLQLTDLMLGLAQSCLGSPDPLVRARMADLLGGSDSVRHAQTLRRLAQEDMDERVRQMAMAYLQQPAPLAPLSAAAGAGRETSGASGVLAPLARPPVSAASSRPATASAPASGPTAGTMRERPAP